MSLIRAFISFIWYLNTIRKDGKNDFLLIGPIRFGKHRISDKFTQILQLDPSIMLTSLFSSSTSTVASSATLSAVSNKNKLAEVFKKSIRQNSILFDATKENKNWYS